MEALLLGSTLGHYRLDAVLGSGGMSVVFLARDLRLSRPVAVKVLSADRLDRRSRDRLRAEGLVLSRLNHPNVATLYDFGQEGAIDYLVMEFVPGTTLDGLLAAGPLSNERVAALGAQLARGLAAAHAADVVHRDIKPGNVRVTPEGLVKILDFGIATSPDMPVWTDTTRSGVRLFQALAGTCRYMAPERLRGGAADARSDIFSVGVVLYEMACARAPFAEEHPIRLIEAILAGRSPRPRSVNPELDPSLEMVILRALASDPGSRYRDAGELAAALEPLTIGDRGRVPWRRRTLRSISSAARKVWEVASSMTVQFGPDSRGLAAVELPDQPVERV
jgi:serine/threonine protein kinase